MAVLDQRFYITLSVGFTADSAHPKGAYKIGGPTRVESVNTTRLFSTDSGPLAVEHEGHQVENLVFCQRIEQARRSRSFWLRTPAPVRFAQNA